ncbi:hypothetical protein CASFOL_030174 [Castilleja foliolosa]|uniref:Uncharacterized protein n=1 Tax=Castilleja foliolosa TaxID=1961234 RepID=A0ABD3C9W9_9LAMI
MVAGFARPLINISKECFGDIMENVVGHALIPPFDPYANDINYLLASYLIPYVGLTGYVGAASNLQDPVFKNWWLGFWAWNQVKMQLSELYSIKNRIGRYFLIKKKSNRRYPPQFYTVADFTNMISEFRDKLGGEGLKDEGIWVDQRLGAEGKVNGNVLAGDEYSMSYERSPNEILRIVYGNKDGVPGGFFPNGAGGKFARAYHN